MFIKEAFLKKNHIWLSTHNVFCIIPKGKFLLHDKSKLFLSVDYLKPQKTDNTQTHWKERNICFVVKWVWTKEPFFFNGDNTVKLGFPGGTSGK